MLKNRHALHALKLAVTPEGVDYLLKHENTKQYVNFHVIKELHYGEQMAIVEAYPVFDKYVDVKYWPDYQKAKYFSRNPENIEKHLAISRLTKDMYSTILSELAGYKFLCKKGLNYNQLNTGGWEEILKKDFKAHSAKFLSEINKFGPVKINQIMESVPEIIPDVLKLGKSIPKGTYRRLLDTHSGYTILKKIGIKYDILNSDAFISILHKNFSLHCMDVVSNLKNIRCTTELRFLLSQYPKLLKFITPEIAEDSVLNAKQWILLKKYSSSIENIKSVYNKDFEEWLELQVSIDVLSGKTKATKQLAKAQGRGK